MTQGHRSPEPQLLGYTAPILRGVWERITTGGVLRGWAHCWAALCLFVGLVTLTYVGLKWVAVPLAIWLLGHGALLLLTQWHDRWDAMAIAQVKRRYKRRYSAG